MQAEPPAILSQIMAERASEPEGQKKKKKGAFSRFPESRPFADPARHVMLRPDGRHGKQGDHDACRQPGLSHYKCARHNCTQAGRK